MIKQELQGTEWLRRMAWLGVLGAVTAAEWLTFAMRHALGVRDQVLVPALLALAAVKFAAVIAWYMRPRSQNAEWREKAWLAAFVMLGGPVIILILL